MAEGEGGFNHWCEMGGEIGGGILGEDGERGEREVVEMDFGEEIGIGETEFSLVEMGGGGDVMDGEVVGGGNDG